MNEKLYLLELELRKDSKGWFCHHNKIPLNKSPKWFKHPEDAIVYYVGEMKKYKVGILDELKNYTEIYNIS